MMNLLNVVDGLLCKKAKNGYRDKEKMVKTLAEVRLYRANGTFPLMQNLLFFIDILCEQSREDRNRFNRTVAACESMGDFINLLMAGIFCTDEISRLGLQYYSILLDAVVEEGGRVVDPMVGVL